MLPEVIRAACFFLKVTVMKKSEQRSFSYGADRDMRCR